ncbi:MAG: alpha/beta hydrolase [Xanthobacteraceae bacterium]|nr:alpha/beta hydrolase [Xanthobacteraceae bacterium]
MRQTLAAMSRGQGRPVVFLHGLGGSSRSWEPQLRNMGDRYHCIAPDLPGYGASPETSPMSFSAWSDALARLLDAMRLDRVVLVGHSLGGMLAQEFMIDHPARVSKLLLSCTRPAFGRKDGNFQKEFIAARLKKLEEGGTMRDVAEEAAPTLFSPSAGREAIDSAVVTMAQVPEKTYRAALDCLVAFDRKEALARIEVPTLLLSAEHDRAAPPLVMERMAERIPHARHASMSGLGHLPNIEAPERFDREVTAFIEAD